MGEIKVAIDFIHLPHAFDLSLEIEIKCKQGIVPIFKGVLHMLFVEPCSCFTTKSGEGQFAQHMMQCIAYNTPFQFFNLSCQSKTFSLSATSSQF